jgi:hypothetical protein
MADIVLGIEQGDIIYYYDTSIGDVVQRDWSFQGGTPTGATSYGPAVAYNGVNTNGYSTTLTVTDAATVVSSITKSNIIVVNPENISANVTASNVNVLMDDTVYYGASATAGSGITGYVWSIPGLGATSGTSLSNVTYANLDWYNLANTYAGSVNTSYVATATLTVTSNVGNTVNSSKNVTFYKMGPSEGFYYNNLYGATASGPYYTPTVTSYSSNDIGLGGSGLVIKIDQSSSLYTHINNLYSHSTDEVVYYLPNSADADGRGYPIRLRIIINKNAFIVLGASYVGNSQFSTGSYILAGGINTTLYDNLYLTDYTTVPNTALTFSNLKNIRYWSTSAINKFLENKYYLSGSSKYIETISPGDLGTTNTLMYNSTYLSIDWAGGYTLTSGFRPGLALPSSRLFFAKFSGAVVTVDVDVNVYREGSGSSLIGTYNVVISSGGSSGAGNTPDNLLITAQDSSYGSMNGLARILGIATASTSFANNIIFEASRYYCPRETITDNDIFQGIAVHIKDPLHSSTGRYIGRVEISWGNAYLSGLSGLGLSAGPLAYPFTSDTGISFTGIRGSVGYPYPDMTRNSYTKGWEIGGAIA